MADHNTLLNSLDDEELLRHFHAEHDPLTSTPITDELAKRFEKLLDENEANERVLGALDDIGIDLTVTGDISLVKNGVEVFREFANPRPVLEALSAHDIHTVDQITKLIEFSDKFRALASDAGDVFTKLNELITTSQES
jgi:predicted hydrolase (HD superfamily)